MIVEWDDQKAHENKAKHDVSFEDALAVLENPLSLTFRDPTHEVEESRLQKARRKASDDMRPEYDLSALGKGVRGKCAGRLKRTTLVALQPEVAEAFPSSAAANEALKAVMKATAVMRRAPTPRKSGAATEILGPARGWRTRGCTRQGPPLPTTVAALAGDPSVRLTYRDPT